MAVEDKQSRLYIVGNMTPQKMKEEYGDNAEIVKNMYDSTMEYKGNIEAERAFEIASNRLKKKVNKNIRRDHVVGSRFDELPPIKKQNDNNIEDCSRL